MILIFRSSTQSESKVDLANKTPTQAFETNRRLVSDQMERMAQQLAGKQLTLCFSVSLYFSVPPLLSVTLTLPLKPHPSLRNQLKTLDNKTAADPKDRVSTS